MSDSPVVCHGSKVHTPVVCSNISSTLPGTAVEIVCLQKQRLVDAIARHSAQPCSVTVTLGSSCVVEVVFHTQPQLCALWCSWPCFVHTSAGWGYLPSNKLSPFVGIKRACRVPIPLTLVFEGEFFDDCNVLELGHHFIGTAGVLLRAIKLPGIGVLGISMCNAAIAVCIDGEKAYLTFDAAAPNDLQGAHIADKRPSETVAQRAQRSVDLAVEKYWNSW